MFSGSIGRIQWHEMVKRVFYTKALMISKDSREI